MFLWVLNLFPALEDHEQALLVQKRTLPQGKPTAYVQCNESIESFAQSIKIEEYALPGRNTRIG